MALLLIIEDEPELVKILKSYLENSGFSVLSTDRGDTGLGLWAKHHPDLVLLDLNLPGMDGIAVAEEIRRQGDTPVIMVTARVEESARLKGLEIGADDYITKPYSPREVVARVRAVLRRAGKSASAEDVIRVHDLVIDKAAYHVVRGLESIELTPTEFSFLSILAANPGRVYSRMQLLESVQGGAYEGYERTVDAHIKNLRAKIEPDPKLPRYVETVFGVGYRMKKAA